MNRSSFRQQGFNMIELLVGMAIGLFAMLAMSQILVAFTQSRGTITQTMETQNNGVMAMYQIERDLNQAGYNFMNLQNCPWINYHWDSQTHSSTPFTTPPSVPTATTNVALTTLPVRIVVDNTDPATVSDTLEIQYGNPMSGVPGSDISEEQANFEDGFKVKSPIGFALGDRYVLNSNSNCTLLAVSSLPTKDAGTGKAQLLVLNELTSPWNAAAGAGGSGWQRVQATDFDQTIRPYLANLGQFVSRRYTVQPVGVGVSANSQPVGASENSALYLAELPNFTGNTLTDDIVFLKAQYGLSSTATSTVVDTWVDGSALLNNTCASRLLAVRFGVVVRSPLYEKNVDAPTTLEVLPAITGARNAAGVVCPTSASGTAATGAVSFTAPGTPPDTHHRYRTYSTIVPLKNAIWNR